eukprot:COSAG01_NODE_39150_length_480_cov_1.209974_2_plen_75_part_00
MARPVADRVRMKVWERGAGPTLACGTGACALVVACVLNGLTERTCVVVSHLFLRTMCTGRPRTLVHLRALGRRA